MREPKVALFAAFHRFWEMSDADVDAPPDNPHGGAEAQALEQLARLDARARRALILSVVEDFAPEDVARILAVSASEAQALVDEAMAGLKRRPSARILILEGEPVTAMDLEALVVEAGHRVIDVVDSRASARAVAAVEAPDLVLADVAMPDGSSGLDAVREIVEATRAGAIFVTAHPERLLTAAQAEPVFLIPKPFRPSAVMTALAQALAFRAAAPRIDPIPPGGAWNDPAPCAFLGGDQQTGL
jgi:CheY-like chemotaxis protein